MTNKKPYNTNLAKGTGFINETLELLSLVEEGDDKKKFLNRCLEMNSLGKSTEKRTKDMISLVFFDRYWKGNVPQDLQEIRDYGFGLEGMKQLFLVYTARANLILKDFIIEYFTRRSKIRISIIDSLEFINNAITEGKAAPWSETMRKRVASYLISCCKDFGLLDQQGQVTVFYPQNFVVNYFIHELHFSGLSDNQILEDDTWSILQLNKNDTLREMEKTSFNGTFIYQYSGELLRISWKYENMKQFIAHECRE